MNGNVITLQDLWQSFLRLPSPVLCPGCGIDVRQNPDAEVEMYQPLTVPTPPDVKRVHAQCDCGVRSGGWYMPGQPTALVILGRITQSS